MSGFFLEQYRLAPLTHECVKSSVLQSILNFISDIQWGSSMSVYIKVTLSPLYVGFTTIDAISDQCLSPLTFWIRIPLTRGVLDKTLYDKVCQWIVAGLWFSPDTPVSCTNKTGRYDNWNIVESCAG